MKKGERKIFASKECRFQRPMRNPSRIGRGSWLPPSLSGGEQQVGAASRSLPPPLDSGPAPKEQQGSRSRGVASAPSGKEEDALAAVHRRGGRLPKVSAPLLGEGRLGSRGRGGRTLLLFAPDGSDYFFF
jgi:hypothetical protein